MTSFAYPTDVRFTCSQCGDCCRTWDVAVSDVERERLEALDWSDKADDLVGVGPSVALKQLPGHRRLRRRDDGACVYLGEHQQCRIHEHFGADLKPLMCRIYPFGFYSVGERVGVDAAFSCRAISEGRGEKLETRLPEWTRSVADGEAGAERKAAHHLRRNVKLKPELLWEIEHQLVDFLSDRKMTLFERVRCMLQWTRIATTGDPHLPTAAQMRSAMAIGIPKQITAKPLDETLDASQRAFFFQWLFVALNPTPSWVGELPAKELEAERKERIRRGNLYRDAQAHPWIDDRELPISFEKIAAVDPGAARPLADGKRDFLESWLRAKILGQRFLFDDGRERPLVDSVPRFLLVYPMALWTAKALAAQRGVEAVASEDVRGAVRLLDRTLGRIPSTRLPKKQAKAAQFLLQDTALVETAVCDVLAGRV